MEIQLGATIESILVRQGRVDQTKKTDEIALTNAADTPTIGG
ncbi:MAG: hypothetical protein SCG84_05670 [Nitrosomonadaceae bacterium]|nr:hypothetical protein [Nitrosomonadaceae bacterium]MDW7647529.1 hypothetical protein [Nitrosomonadaceae bacterium]MDW7667128.1 hypothetical protein [Nitrosomonadaceae bacterium]